MKLMERNKNFFKSQYKKAERFFTHLPLFAKYFTVMTALLLVSYLVLASALLIFLVNRWSMEKKELLLENVQQNAAYCETIFESCDTQEEINRAMLLVSNNIGITSNAIDADVFLCDREGRVVLCKENFTNGVFTEDGKCKLHADYDFPDEITTAVEKGLYFNDKKVPGLFEENTFVAAAPVKVHGQVVGAVFALDSVENSMKEYIGNILKMYLSSMLFAICLSFIVVYAFTAKLTSPLRQMSMATKAYAQGDFSKRITVRGTDEFAELCRSFNQMASALSILESSRRSFVANVSHELKTPMTTIGGFVDGILDGTISEDKRDEYLQIVSNEVKRLSRLVVSMLNLSKIEAGELKLKYSDFDISSVIIDCVLNFEQAIEKNEIAVEGLENLNVTPVHADRDMIHQVIYNLVDNAVKFTNKNGRIGISAGETNDGKIYITIQNTGEGVSPEEIGRIFERFYKVDKSRSYDVKSAGLGLYLCKTIVDMHGGKIFAESVQGQYIGFTIILDKGKQEKNKK